MWREGVIPVNGTLIYSAGHTKALDYARKTLEQYNCLFASAPSKKATHLLLDVPSFDKDGSLRGGGDIAPILAQLDSGITVIGGNLQHPALANYKTVDLLRDPFYIAENADITAHCAVTEAATRLPVTLKGCQVLVIGWGRIGKCLAGLLKGMGAVVSVAARKEADRAMLQTLGYDTEDAAKLDYSLVRYRVIFNTAPAPVIAKDALQYCNPDCLLIDLASEKGIDSPAVIWARGLPNKNAPESSGKLIARSILRLR